MNKKLQKNITFINAFSIASGAMISSGLFILPGIVFAEIGSTIILAYFVASLLMIPTMFVQSELATAMPRAGGAYFYIMRILGSETGFIAGVSNWFSVSLKSAFALIGIGTFITIFYPEASHQHIRYLAAGAAVFFTLLNLLSTKHSSGFQTIMLFFLLGILLFFIGGGYPEVNLTFYKNFFSIEINAFFAAVGMIFVSYGGLTKIASMSEEIKDSKKNLPKAMFFAFIVINIFYLLVISILVGILPKDVLGGNLAPIANAAQVFAGKFGFYAISLAALLAFVTTANAGIMAASRSPLAMGRDGLLPEVFTKLSSKHKTPYFSIIITGTFIVASILLLPIEKLVKVASAVMLILFILDNLSLIIVRTTKLRNYKPSFKAPLCPYLQIIAIFFYLLLLNKMGHEIMFMTLFLILGCLIWFYIYARKKKFSQSALILLANKFMNKKIIDSNHAIEDELFEILQNREEINEDFFDLQIKKSLTMDINEELTRDKFFTVISEKLEKILDLSAKEIYDEFVKREKISSTNIADGLAIPHLVIPGKNKFSIDMIRIKDGIVWQEDKPKVKAVFVLIGTLDKRDFHLKALMAVAQLLQQKDFFTKWLAAKDAEDLKNMIRLMPRNR